MALDEPEGDASEDDHLDRRKVLGMVGGLMAATAGIGEVAADERGGTEPSYEVYGVFSDEDAPPESLKRAMARIEDDAAAAEYLDGAVYQTNGCGAEGGIDVPDGNWGGCCDAHDICYGEGGDSSDRLQCDNFLYSCMSIFTTSHVATTYYLAVRVGGGSSFNWD